jgi:hypothetical protein
MFNFLEKAKEAPNLNVKILCPERQINIYITPKKNSEHTILSIPNVFHRKDNPTTACLVSFFDKDNYIITLL